jgi:hypothetical protein
MKTLNPLKVPFGEGRFSRIRNVRYLQWEDAFEIDFEDGLSFLEPHATIRKASRIPAAAVVRSVEVEPETRSGFYVHYASGQTAEVSWAFIRELAPPRRKPSKAPGRSSRAQAGA